MDSIFNLIYFGLINLVRELEAMISGRWFMTGTAKICPKCSLVIVFKDIHKDITEMHSDGGRQTINIG